LKRYRLSLEAQSDLIDIKAYLIEAGGARLARYVLGEIRQALQMLAQNPGAGHVRDDITDEPVKFWPVFAYLIIYDPAMQPLGVARVLHASQDVESLLKRRPPRV